MFSLDLSQSNKADFNLYISAKDETGADIDFTGADIAFQINDARGGMMLSASTSDGKITLPTPTQILVAFTASDMSKFCPGQYPVGAIYELAGATNQLLSGNMTVYEGVASL